MLEQLYIGEFLVTVKCMCKSRAVQGGMECSHVPLLIMEKGDLNKKYISPQMIKYCINKENQCRREILFEEFDDDCQDIVPASLCLCCYACKLKCSCGKCDFNIAVFPIPNY